MSDAVVSKMPPRIATGIGLGVLLVGGVLAGRFGGFDFSHMENLADWVRALGPLGWLVFVAAQVSVAMIGIVPASLLGVAAGATYGIGLGFLLSSIGTLIGGWLAFALARSLLRDWIAGRMARRAGGIRFDEAIGRDGWRLVCLLRVSPVMPFAVTSYALGLTSISPRAYLIGTLAALPALLGYVAIGALAGMSLSAASGEAGAVRMAMLGLGIVATGVLTLRLGHLLRKAGVLAPCKIA